LESDRTGSVATPAPPDARPGRFPISRANFKTLVSKKGRWVAAGHRESQVVALLEIRGGKANSDREDWLWVFGSLFASHAIPLGAPLDKDLIYSRLRLIADVYLDPVPDDEWLRDFVQRTRFTQKISNYQISRRLQIDRFDAECLEEYVRENIDNPVWPLPFLGHQVTVLMAYEDYLERRRRPTIITRSTPRRPAPVKERRLKIEAFMRDMLPHCERERPLSATKWIELLVEELPELGPFARASIKRYLKKIRTELTAERPPVD
jgi:hypothetical protein